MTEQDQKAAFAAFLLRAPSEPMEAALKVFPADKDRGMACYAALNWPSDDVVIEEIKRLKDDGFSEIESGLSKDELLNELAGMVTTSSIYFTGKDRIAAARLLAEIKGFINKDGDNDSKLRMPKMPVYTIVNE